MSPQPIKETGPELEQDACTICTGIKNRDDPKADDWPGFYRGCICQDQGGTCNGWSCDGEGNLHRVAQAWHRIRIDDATPAREITFTLRTRDN